MTGSAPWLATLTSSQHMLIFYFLVVTGLALLAGFVRTVASSGEVGARYRSATIARLCVNGIAFLTYVALVLTFHAGYSRVGDNYVPNDLAVNLIALRYTDWSISVPLLAVELIAVCALAGRVMRTQRVIAVGSAFLMIFTGYLGAVVFEDNGKLTHLIFWGSVSVLFWIIANYVLIKVVRASYAKLTPESADLLRSATVILLGGWAIYPIIYVIPLFGAGGGWTTVIQVALCVTDLTIKVGFSGLIHRIAKLRTAEDVRTGNDMHQESIWISSEKKSDAGKPRDVYLADGAAVHRPRTRPPASSAVAAGQDTPLEDFESDQ